MSYRDGDDQTQTGRLPEPQDVTKISFSYVCSLAWNDSRGRSVQGSNHGLVQVEPYQTMYEIEDTVLAHVVKMITGDPKTAVTILFLSIRPNLTATEF